MSSIWAWGARVLLGLDEKKPRIHGPGETYAPRSFTSKARGSAMLHKWIYEKDSKYDNKDWTQGWVHMYEARDRELRFWVLTKQVPAVFAALRQMRLINATESTYWDKPGRKVQVQTDKVHERWTMLVLRGRW